MKTTNNFEFYFWKCFLIFLFLSIFFYVLLILYYNLMMVTMANFKLNIFDHLVIDQNSLLKTGNNVVRKSINIMLKLSLLIEHRCI